MLKDGPPPLGKKSRLGFGSLSSVWIRSLCVCVRPAQYSGIRIFASLDICIETDLSIRISWTDSILAILSKVLLIFASDGFLHKICWGPKWCANIRIPLYYLVLVMMGERWRTETSQRQERRPREKIRHLNIDQYAQKSLCLTSSLGQKDEKGCVVCKVQHDLVRRAYRTDRHFRKENTGLNKSLSEPWMKWEQLATLIGCCFLVVHNTIVQQLDKAHFLKRI